MRRTRGDGSEQHIWSSIHSASTLLSTERSRTLHIPTVSISRDIVLTNLAENTTPASVFSTTSDRDRSNASQVQSLRSVAEALALGLAVVRYRTGDAEFLESLENPVTGLFAGRALVILDADGFLGMGSDAEAVAQRGLWGVSDGGYWREDGLT